MKVRLMSAQPASPFYAWQTEVYLNNFLSLGYNGNYIDVVAAITDGIPDEWIKLQQKFPYVRFFFYRDDNPNRLYKPSVQAHILKKHFSQFPELKDDAVFFHDCDFIFTKYFDFSPYLRDKNWYFSNCDSYIGADYIESKGSRIDNEGAEISILDDMAKVVGICACVIRARRGQSGGAQKLMKGVTSEYWAEVEEDSDNLYQFLLDNKDKYTEGRNDIQIWTASMWSELWNAWKRGVNVMTPKDFDFCWATCHESKWFENSFYHNAGVVNDKSGMFFKGGFVDKLPYGVDMDLDPNRCSKRYYDLVQQVAAQSVLI